jgi:hypothetical protein
MIVFMGTGVMGQMRQVDQGKVGVKPWLITLCDTTGTACGNALVIPVSGTMTANAGTGTFNVTCISGCGGAASFLDTGGFTFGTTPIGIMGAVVDTAASHTVGDGLAGAPRMGTNRILFMDLSKSAAFSIANTTFTAAQGAAGGTGWPVTESGTWPVTQSGAWGVTASAGTGTFNTHETGTANVTFTNTAIQANAGTGTQNVTFTNTAIQSNQGTAANTTAGWPTIGGYITTSTALTSASPLDTTAGLNVTGYSTFVVYHNPVGTLASGTILIEGSNNGGAAYFPIAASRIDSTNALSATSFSVASAAIAYTAPIAGLDHARVHLNPQITNTGTDNLYLSASNMGRDSLVSVQSANSALGVSVNGSGLTTAGPLIAGLRGSTTVPSAVADAALVAARGSKYGDVLVAFAPPDLETTGTAQPTATTATAVIAASGAATNRWKIMSIKVCNFSGTVATEMDITDSSGTIDKFVWTATALNGEPQCFLDTFPDGWPAAANSSISAKLTVSDASGVFVAIKANKTGT